MDFRLVFRGILRGNNRRALDKHMIRAQIHPQLRLLWNQVPLSGLSACLTHSKTNDPCILIKRHGLEFAPLINNVYSLRADLDILLLEPYASGQRNSRADIDNKIKTLIDGLRLPDKRQEFSEDARKHYSDSPFHCLLEDDSLISNFSVTTDRLLDARSEEESMAIIRVFIRAVTPTWAGMALATGSIP